MSYISEQNDKFKNLDSNKSECTGGFELPAAMQPQASIKNYSQRLVKLHYGNSTFFPKVMERQAMSSTRSKLQGHPNIKKPSEFFFF